MFIRWKKRRLAPWDSSSATTCRHQGARDRLTPAVLYSYKNGERHSVHETIWRPGVSINECCIVDPVAKQAFWEAMDARIAALSTAPLDSSAAGILVDRVEWLRASFVKRVPMLVDRC